MNVGLIVPGFSANAADWCIPALRHLVRTLATQDDVRVIAIRYPYTRGRYTVDRAEVVSLGGGVVHGAATLRLWRETLQVLHAEHVRRRFDVLHAFWATESGLLAALAGRFLGVPTLVSLAGGELVRLPDIAYGDQRIAWERVKVAASLRLASAVTAGSRLLQGLAERHLGGRKPVHVAPLGVDLSLFSPAHVDEARRIVHVGTLTPVKDHATLLHAFRLARQDVPDATLQIVGSGPLATDLHQLSGELGLDDSVCFRGEVDHAQLASVYRGASACIVSSRHEAQCMVALEAAACGVPLAGTRVGVLPELTSALANVGDVAALAKAMRAVVCAASTPDEVTAHVRAEYGLEACADRFRGIYAALSRRQWREAND
jgi:glycosyltransferase involved in cell wall biosynthesis